MAGGPIGGHGPNRVIEFVPNRGLIPDTVTAFDPALMVTMEKHGNDPLILPPQVVASGMTPPEQMPT